MKNPAMFVAGFFLFGYGCKEFVWFRKNTYLCIKIIKMAALKLNIEDNKLAFFMELIQNFDFIQIEDEDSDVAIRQNIKQGWQEIKMIENGTLKAKPIAALLNEL